MSCIIVAVSSVTHRCHGVIRHASLCRASVLCVVHHHCCCRDTVAMAICITSLSSSCHGSCHPVVGLASPCRACVSWVVGHCHDAVAKAMCHIIVVVGCRVMRPMGRGLLSLLCRVLCIVVHHWCQCSRRKCERETYLQSIPMELWT